jgi:soluble lytic murein transglycosylase-like protein
MNFGQFLSNAGATATSMRAAEESERVAQENQLKIEEQNRFAAFKAKMAQDAARQRPQVSAPQFQTTLDPASFSQSDRLPVDVLPPPAAAPAPAPAPAVPVSAAPAANEGLGLRRMSPEEVARLQQQQAGNLPATGMSQYEFQSLTPTERLRRLQIENDQRRINVLAAATGKIPAAAADIPAAFYQGATTLLEQGANAIGIPRFGRALGIYDPDVTRVEIPKFSSATPNYDKIRQIEIDNQPLTEAQFLEQLKKQDTKKIKQVQEKQTREKQAAPTKPNKTALSYDNKVTPYDALIQQSAIQYGIDPVVFKRLLGTESSFNPTAVSPRGEKYGLGIAQIASSHGLSREQMLDPNIAIPAGAQIFAAMLNKAGGNYELALQRYKGASSEKGKAAMAGPISIILSGLVPSAQAAPPATAVRPGGNMTAAQIAALEADPYAMKATPPAPAAVAPAAVAPAAVAPAAVAPADPAAPPAAAPAAAAPAAAVPATATVVRTDADFYLGNPQSIPYEYQQLTRAYQQVASQAQEQANLVTQQRNETARLAQMYMQSGTTAGIDTAMRMRDAINNYDIELLKLKQGVSNEQLKVTQGRVYLEGMQGLQELALTNDPRRLASVWSQYAGVPIGIQPRSDGTFNIMVNGKKTKEGVTPAELSNNARLAFDQTYRQQQAAAGAEMNKFMTQERYKSMLTIQQGNAAELAKMIREISVENTKGNNAQALEWAKANFGWDIKPTGAGDGTLIIRPPNGAPYVYNPAGTTVKIDNIEIKSNAAQLISGLPIPTQQRLNAVR